MKFLSGKISDRLRADGGRGEQPMAQYQKYERPEEVPDATFVKTGEGHGLGKGATHERNER